MIHIKDSLLIESIANKVVAAGLLTRYLSFLNHMPDTI